MLQAVELCRDCSIQDDVMQQYGVAVHGAGWVSAEHVRAFDADPRAKVIAISSRREASAVRVAHMTGHQEAIIETDLDRVLARDDIQILVVCTPHDLHPENTIAAAKAGKHILIEKPAALDVPSLRRMHEAVSEAGVQSVVSFVLRWNPLFDVIKAQQANGALGRIYMAEVDYVHGMGPWYGQYEWSKTLAQGRSSFLSAGCHAIDALRYFTESDVIEVSAYTVAGSDRFEYPGTTVMICKFANGSIGKALSNLDDGAPYKFRISLYGDRGTMLDNRIHSQIMSGQTDYAEIPTILPDNGDVSHHPFRSEVSHLLDCIATGQESHVSLGNSINTHEACIAADISAAEGRPVGLPLP